MLGVGVGVRVGALTEVGEELDGEDGVDAHDDDHDQECIGDAGHGLGERGHDLGEGGHALEQAEDTERTERPEQPEGGRQDLDVRSELDQRDRAWIALGLACGRALGLRFGLPGAR